MVPTASVAVRIPSFLVLAIAVTACAASQGPTATPVPTPFRGTITYRGIVQDLENYTRLGNVTVEIAMVGDSNKPFAIAATDEHGEFAFSGLEPGEYMLHIGRPGYNETRMRIDTRNNDDKPLDVRLRSLRSRCVQSRYHTDCP